MTQIYEEPDTNLGNKLDTNLANEPDTAANLKTPQSLQAGKEATTCTNDESLQVVASISSDARKDRTRKLINMGGLVAKADLEILPASTLYGGLLTLRNQLHGKSKEEMFALLNKWTYLGKQSFDNMQKKGSRVALSFNKMPSKEGLSKLKALGLKWNAFRKEWEGIVCDIDHLKKELASEDYSLQTL